MGISRSGSRSGDRPTSTRQSSREQGTVLQDVDAMDAVQRSEGDLPCAREGVAFRG